MKREYKYWGFQPTLVVVALWISCTVQTAPRHKVPTRDEALNSLEQRVSQASNPTLNISTVRSLSYLLYDFQRRNPDGYDKFAEGFLKAFRSRDEVKQSLMSLGLADTTQAENFVAELDKFNFFDAQKNISVSSPYKTEIQDLVVAVGQDGREDQKSQWEVAGAEKKPNSQQSNKDKPETSKKDSDKDKDDGKGKDSAQNNPNPFADVFPPGGESPSKSDGDLAKALRHMLRDKPKNERGAADIPNPSNKDKEDKKPEKKEDAPSAPGGEKKKTAANVPKKEDTSDTANLAGLQDSNNAVGTKTPPQKVALNGEWQPSEPIGSQGGNAAPPILGGSDSASANAFGKTPVLGNTSGGNLTGEADSTLGSFIFGTGADNAEFSDDLIVPVEIKKYTAGGEDGSAESADDGSGESWSDSANNGPQTGKKPPAFLNQVLPSISGSARRPGVFGAVNVSSLCIKSFLNPYCTKNKKSFKTRLNEG